MMLGTTFRTGNISLIDLRGTARVQYKTEKNLTFLVANGQFAAKRTFTDYTNSPEIKLLSEEARYANKYLAHLRNSYTLKDRVSVEVFSQYEANEFILLEQRILLGAGPRMTVFSTESSEAHFGTAYMFEREDLNEEKLAASESPLTEYHRSSSYLTLSWKASESTTFLSTTYFQTRLNDFSDYRILADLALKFGITENISFSVGFYTRHDSQPPETAEEEADLASTDTSTTNTINIKF